MSVNEQFKPMLLLTVNNSIGNKSKHFTINRLIQLFSKKVEQYSNLDKYAVDTIQTEATQTELNNFIKNFNIATDKVKYVLSVNPY
jgi:hypothetical protein